MQYKIGVDVGTSGTKNVLFAKGRKKRNVCVSHTNVVIFA